MGRKRSRSGTGKSKNRFPSKRFFIATEGVSEYIYFKEVKKQLRARNMEVLKPTPQTSPEDIVERVRRYRPKKGDIRGEDERWAVIDKDGHDLPELVARAQRKRLFVADSNPCFEIWLILHFKPLNKLKGLEGSAAVGGCDKVIDELRERFDRMYHKTRYDVSSYVELWETAMANAEITDRRNDEQWMNSIGTRVYKLAQSIIDSSPNNPGN